MIRQISDVCEKQRVPFYSELESVLEAFNTIALAEMDDVKLMNRIDCKYWFPIQLLPTLLRAIHSDYQLLEINNKRFQDYVTSYFDTPRNDFYINHHNGRTNRLKVRKREYVGSGIHFLELKRKSKKGRTKKTRIESSSSGEALLEKDLFFLEQQIEELSQSLDFKIRNQFNRITLVNKNRLERCTIDFEICFSTETETQELGQIAIIELKHDGRNVRSRLKEVLKEHHIQSSGFSKYCIGRAIMEPTLKQNRLKPSLMKLKQLA